MTQYRVLVGIDYPPDRRAEAGTLVTDIPEKSAKWLLDQGLIELSDGTTRKAEPVIEIEPVIEVEPVVEVEPEVTFDPEATDGDKDGFVQDGTEFQRPVEETN
jgi:hypothetical protein